MKTFLDRHPRLKDIRWTLTYVILAILLGIPLWALGLNAQPLAFAAIDGAKIVGLLTPLFIIALFLERAQEVFVTSWRDTKKTEIEAKAELAKYQTETRRIAFLFGFAVAAMVSIVGVRALEPLVTITEPTPGGAQLTAFKILDVLLTAALIGGGSDGIHKLVSVITDSLDKTRELIKKKA